MDRVPVDELDRRHNQIGYPDGKRGSDHLQDVSVGEEGTRKVETNGEWMRFRWGTELDDRPRDDAFVDTKLTHPGNGRTYDFRHPTNQQQTIDKNIATMKCFKNEWIQINY